MIQRQSPFLQVHRLQAEIERLRDQLNFRAAQAEVKDSIINHLESRLLQKNSQESPPQQGRMEREPASLLEKGVGESELAVAGREEMGVGNQLAAEKEQQLAELRQQLAAKDELIATLQISVSCLQQTVQQQVHAIGAMDGELNSLQRENLSLQSALEQQQAAKTESSEDKQHQQFLEENKIKLQNIIIQNEKLREILQQESKNFCNQQMLIKGMLAQSQKNKKIISNYDWKLFCIETEMELAVKERKMFKEESEQKESRLKEQSERMASLQEEMKLITEENNFFEMQLSQKQMKIEELLIEIDNLRDMQEHSDIKDLHYRIKEKEEEIKEITAFLKEKISETHQFKARCNQLESSLQDVQRKKEKLQFEGYYAQSKLAEQKERNQKQADQLQEMHQQRKKLKDILNDYKEGKNASEAELNQLVVLVNNKDREIDKLSRKLDYFETSVKGKDKTIQILQADLKQVKSQLRETRFMNQRCQEELEDIKEIMAVSGEKLKILKREAVDNIECEINYELELEQTKKKQIALESENQAMMLKQKRQEETIQRMKEELKNLSSIAKKVREITEFIAAEPKEEETTTFEILADQNCFEPSETVAERQRAQLRQKMEQYSAEVDAICHKYQ